MSCLYCVVQHFTINGKTGSSNAAGISCFEHQVDSHIQASYHCQCKLLTVPSVYDFIIRLLDSVPSVSITGSHWPHKAVKATLPPPTIADSWWIVHYAKCERFKAVSLIKKNFLNCRCPYTEGEELRDVSDRMTDRLCMPSWMSGNHAHYILRIYFLMCRKMRPTTCFLFVVFKCLSFCI